MHRVRTGNKIPYRRGGRILLALVVWLFGSIAPGERLPIKTYTVADGLPRDDVMRIRRDSRGFLWLCTADGLSRFDGYGFTNFSTANGLPDRHVNDFLETRAGAIYVATDRGLAVLEPLNQGGANSSQPFTLVRSLDSTQVPVNVLLESSSGTVYGGGESGLFVVGTDRAIHPVATPSQAGGTIPTVVTALMQNRRGEVWVGAENGVFRVLPTGSLEYFGRESGLPDLNVTTVMEDAAGRMWVGLRPNEVAGLVRLVPNPVTGSNVVERYFTTREGLPSDWIMDLLQSSRGEFWVATPRGLCRWREGEGSVCKTYNAANDLCDIDARSLAEDKDGNLWVASPCGLKKWSSYGFTAYATPAGLINQAPDAIFENATGEVFASYNDGEMRYLSRFDGEAFQAVKPNFPAHIGYFGWGNRQTVWQDRAGDWWFPSAEGLVRFPRVKQLSDLADAIPQIVQPGGGTAGIFRLFEDSRGDLWASVFRALPPRRELWRWERSTNVWHDLSGPMGIGNARTAISFVEDRSGNIWIGTGSDQDQSALIRYHDGQIRVFTRADDPRITGWLHDLFVDSRDRLWIADPASGLLRFDQPASANLALSAYTPAEGLSTIAVSCVSEDAFGRIYVGTTRGLDRLNPDTGQVENFTTADGLPASFVELCERSRNGELWFGTTKGVARLTPEPVRNRQPPNVLITGLRIAGVVQPLSILGESRIQNLELNSSQRQLTLDFLGLGASLGEKLRYEYRQGDGPWINTNERTLNFANLAAGSYRFEIRAVSADRIYSQPAVISFRIAAPVWQRWWFILLVGLLTAGVIYAFYRVRLQRLLELEKVRTRIASDLHDDIGADLARISFLSEAVRQKRTNGDDRQLSSIADIARQSIASMNDIVWAISPDHDRLLDLTRRMREHAGEVCAACGIELEFVAPAASATLPLSVGTRRDLLLIFKEALNNAVRHSAATKVNITVALEARGLRLRVEDNGRGIDDTAEPGGNGLRSMKRRAGSLGGTLSINSAHGTGTVVELNLPLDRVRVV